MKRALVLNTDWQDIEKHLKNDCGYNIIWFSDTKEHALEWCRTHKVDLIVGAYHMGVVELNESLNQHMAVSGSVFETVNPKVLLTWSPLFTEDRLDGPDVVPPEGVHGDDYVHDPHPNIVASGLPQYRKPMIREDFSVTIHRLVSGSI